jgi:hypothetical protein
MYEMPFEARFHTMIRVTLITTFLSSASLFAVPVFIGTNTGGNTQSKGIYLADFDSATGTLSEPSLVAEYRNPGFLAAGSRTRSSRTSRTRWPPSPSGRGAS